MSTHLSLNERFATMAVSRSPVRSPRGDLGVPPGICMTPYGGFVVPGPPVPPGTFEPDFVQPMRPKHRGKPSKPFERELTMWANAMRESQHDTWSTVLSKIDMSRENPPCMQGIGCKSFRFGKCRRNIWHIRQGHKPNGLLEANYRS